MCAKKTFIHTKLKNRAIVWNYAFTLYLCLLLRACEGGTENLSNFPYAQPTPTTAAAATPTAASSFVAAAASPTTTLISTPSSSSSSSLSSSSKPNFNSPSTYINANAGTRTILRIYDECSRSEVGFVPCLKKKAISFIDRISHIDTITVADGVKLVRLPNADSAAVNTSPHLQPLYSDNDVESSLSRSGNDRDTKLTNMLIERLSYFFNGHTLQVNFPKLTAEEIGRGLEEGRGKMKKMMSMMMMGMAMKMVGMIPVAMGMLYMMAGKALIISKIALMMAGMMALKKLMNGRGGGSSGWSSGGGGGGWSSGGGYDRRSIDEAQDLAYRGYSNRQTATNGFLYSAEPPGQKRPQQQQQQKHQQQQNPLSLQQQHYQQPKKQTQNQQEQHPRQQQGQQHQQQQQQEQYHQVQKS